MVIIRWSHFLSITSYINLSSFSVFSLLITFLAWAYYGKTFQPSAFPLWKTRPLIMYFSPSHIARDLELLKKIN